MTTPNNRDARHREILSEEESAFHCAAIRELGGESYGWKSLPIPEDCVYSAMARCAAEARELALREAAAIFETEHESARHAWSITPERAQQEILALIEKEKE